jgi:hypothetical protein
MNTDLLGEGRIETGLSTLGEPMSKGNVMFERFWKEWPSNPRKGAKSKCKQTWEKTYCDTQSDTILKHLAWLKTTEQWIKSNGAFIPAPLVYLNQQRWDGADVPDLVVKPERDPELTRLEEERKKAVPMPEEVRLRLAQLRGRN